MTRRSPSLARAVRGKLAGLRWPARPCLAKRERRLPGPALERPIECLHVREAEAKCDVGVLQLTAFEVAQREVLSEAVDDLREGRSFALEPSGERPRAH